MRFFVYCLLILSFSTYGKTVQQVIYPQPQSPYDERDTYRVQLLQHALDASKDKFGDYQMKPAKVLMRESRYRRKLAANQGVTVIWSATTKQLEKELRPIRIPLFRGLLGYRLFLIHEDKVTQFSKVHSIRDLQKYEVGQGLDWEDVKVFEHNEISVKKGISYESLFSMLAAKRFDYFSRGLNEIFTEYEVRKSKYPQLAIDKHVLLYYPWPVYFFVNQENTTLAERLEYGLETLIERGEYLKLFNKFYQPMIQQADIQSRRLIRLENPMLPERTPLERTELWVKF